MLQQFWVMKVFCVEIPVGLNLNTLLCYPFATIRIITINVAGSGPWFVCFMLINYFNIPSLVVLYSLYANPF